MSNSTENFLLAVKKIRKLLTKGTFFRPFFSCFSVSETHKIKTVFYDRFFLDSQLHKTIELYENFQSDSFKHPK